MKICLAVTNYEKGGIGSVIFNEAKYLNLEGHDVLIATLNRTKEPPQGVEIRELNNSSKIEYIDCDLFHLHDSLPFLRELDSDCVLTHHGWPPWYLTPELMDKLVRPFYYLAMRWELRKDKVKKVLPVSHSSKEDVSFVERKCQVLRNGVDVSFFKPRRKVKSPESPSFVYLGAWCKQKSTQDLVRAMDYITREFPEAKLSIAGYGPDENKIKNARERLDLNDQVHLKGFVAKAKLPNFYNSSDVFLSASKWEAHPLPVLEAMACGRPVIARNIPAMKEQSVKTPAIKVYEELEEIPEMVKEIISNYENYSEKALEYAKSHSWENHTKELLKIYRNSSK